MQIELNENLVHIHAHVCGDGNMYMKKEKRSPSAIKNSRMTEPFYRHVIEYTNYCPELLDKMTLAIKSLFPKTYVYRDNKKRRIQARNKPLYCMLKMLKYIDGSNWDIPQEIVENERFRKIWLRAIFDDEGSVYKSCIVCYNTNKKAVLTIQKMLALEGIRTTLYNRLPTKLKYKICYTIRIPSESFLEFKKIGFDHSIKKKKYEDYCKEKMHRPGCVQEGVVPFTFESPRQNP